MGRLCEIGFRGPQSSPVHPIAESCPYASGSLAKMVGYGFIAHKLSSILLRRFPQFNSVSIRIHDPRKPSVIGVLAMRINLDSCLLQLL